MDISIRTQQLNDLFSYEKKADLAESHLEIVPFRFTQTIGADEIEEFQKGFDGTEFRPIADNHILENKSFTYTIFTPSSKVKRDKAIILLHGLNERTWEKYLTWAEYLAQNTGKPVILFPIAFHMNRTPNHWCNPRETLSWANVRKSKINGLCNSTFANVTLSSRLSKNPLRFYASGRESVYNLWQLVLEIKEGKHPLFKEDTSINLFAYSIGALLSQVLLLANPEKMFNDTRLFMFCGGSILSEMDGNARDIMDKNAYESIQKYYRHYFLEERFPSTSFKNDFIEQAFKAMIREDVMQDYRETFFQKACNRIRAISLKKDKVMPTLGVVKALGNISDKILEEMDFPFSYSHQVPFPFRNKSNQTLINQSFLNVFGKVAAFL